MFFLSFCGRGLRPTSRGLKPFQIQDRVRGAEAPLFHGIPRISKLPWACRSRLVVKPVPEFYVELAGEVPVKAPVGDAVVVEGAAVGDVQGGDGGGEVVAEIFAEGNI